MTTTATSNRRKPALRRCAPPNAYRSPLEARIADQLKANDIAFTFEADKLLYTVPARMAKYLPDFRLANGIYIEAKGWLKAKDRQKMILVKQANPELDIRFVFQRASNPIYAGSNTTYGKWAEDHGFPYADNGTVPLSWAREKPNKTP